MSGFDYVPKTCEYCGGEIPLGGAHFLSHYLRKKFCSKRCSSLNIQKDRPFFLEKFWAKVDRRGPDDCWPWTASTNQDGYGKMVKGGRSQGAHRISWEIANRRRPDGDVLHSCDNSRCVNPRHLTVGTHCQNMRDAAERGRFWGGRIGERNVRAKLSEEDAVEIVRAGPSSPREIEVLADRFAVSTSTIRDISVGRTWKHLRRPRRVTRRPDERCDYHDDGACDLRWRVAELCWPCQRYAGRCGKRASPASV